MRRTGLAVAMVALLAVGAGCGSSSSTAERTAIPSAIQLRLGIGAQQRLRASLHDTSIEVTDVRCGASSGEVTSCVLNVVDHSGHRGTFGLGVRVDRSTHSVRLGWTGTTNRYWRGVIEKQAHGQRQQGSARRAR
jgi:hypothetical protein